MIGSDRKIQYYTQSLPLYLFFFAKNNGIYIIFHSYRKIDADDAKTQFFLQLSTVLPCMLREKYAFKVLFYAKSKVWSLPVTRERRRSHHSICHCRKPRAIRKVHRSILQNRIYCRSIFLHCGNREFGVFFCEK